MNSFPLLHFSRATTGEAYVLLVCRALKTARAPAPLHRSMLVTPPHLRHAIAFTPSTSSSTLNLLRFARGPSGTRMLSHLFLVALMVSGSLLPFLGGLGRLALWIARGRLVNLGLHCAECAAARCRDDDF